MAYLPLVVIVITMLISDHSFAKENKSNVLLHCTGKKHIKHYGATEDLSASVNINWDKKELLLNHVQEVRKLNLRGKASKRFFKEIKDVYTIVNIFDGYLALKKTGSVNNDSIVFNESSSGEGYRVKIKKDDTAAGKLDRFSGNLNIETKYYHTKGDEFEYGWAIKSLCKKKEKLF
jgi:hypothetical protein